MVYIRTSLTSTYLFDWQSYLDVLEGALNIGKQADSVQRENIEKQLKFYKIAKI